MQAMDFNTLLARHAEAFADKLALQEPLGHGPIQDWLAATARGLGLWLVGGTLPLACDGAGEGGAVGDGDGLDGLGGHRAAQLLQSRGRLGLLQCRGNQL